MIRGHVDSSNRSAFNVRAIVVAGGDGPGETRHAYDPRQGTSGLWVEIPHASVASGAEVPTVIDLPADVARALYDALRWHYGDHEADDGRARYQLSEARRAVLEDTLCDLVKRMYPVDSPSPRSA